MLVSQSVYCVYLFPQSELQGSDCESSSHSAYKGPATLVAKPGPDSQPQSAGIFEIRSFSTDRAHLERPRMRKACAAEGTSGEGRWDGSY